MSHRLPLNGIRILCFVGDDYEDLELWYPKFRIEEAGGHVTLAGPAGGANYRGKHGYPCRSDAAIAEMEVEDFHGVIVPGGWMPDKLRRDSNVLDLIRGFHSQQKLIAAICHGGWIPISAKILMGKRATGTTAIKDDLENAGAIWVDEPVVIDGNLVSSRTPKDLAKFGEAMAAFLAKGRG